MPHLPLKLPVAAACLVALAQGRLKTGHALGGFEAVRPHSSHGMGPKAGINASRKTLEKLAPFVIKVDVCGGLVNQRIAIVDGITMALLLGMQILLPDTVAFNGMQWVDPKSISRAMSPLDFMIDLQSLIQGVNDLYKEYWCGDKRHEPRSALWCDEHAYNAFVSSASAAVVGKAFHDVHSEDRGIRLLKLPRKATMTSHNLRTYRRKLVLDGKTRTFLDGRCTLFSLQAKESDREMWQLWWRVDSMIKFVDSINDSAAKFMDAIESYGPLARQRAAERGFPALSSQLKGDHAYNVLHLRVEEDWVNGCIYWKELEPDVHHDNCMNNTQNIADVLVTEGMDPRMPLYVSTGATIDELRKMRLSEQYGHGFQGLTEVFTVLTKEAILEGLKAPPIEYNREEWAAVDFALSSAAKDFVGNSVSTFSTYIIMTRLKEGKSAWHYNGGTSPMQEMGALRPSTTLSIPTFREPLKWVFTIHKGERSLSSSYLQMVKVAVLSARKQTTLIPICVTTEGPRSALSTWLVSAGVRVVHHTPAWAPAVRTKVLDRNGDPDGAIDAFLHIDIPILGFLDEFVLYTDVDVMFMSEIDWSVLLPAEDLKLIRRGNDFARGKWSFSRPGTQGLPLFYSTSSRMIKSTQPDEFHNRIMVLNMRSLRDTYENFKQFVLTQLDLQPSQSLGYNGAYEAFYRSPDGGPHATVLPEALTWQHHAAPVPEAKIVHSVGSRCQSHTEPDSQRGQVGRNTSRPIAKLFGKDNAPELTCYQFNAYAKQGKMLL